MPAPAPPPPAPPPPSPPKPATISPPTAVPHGTPSKPEPSKEPDDLRASLEAAFAPAKPDPGKAPDKPTEKADATGKPSEQPKTEQQSPAKPKPTPENNFAAMRKKIEELEAERDVYKSKAEKPEPIEEHPQFKTQAQRLAELEKKHEEAEKELKIANYARSAEYREKYKKPLEKAWAEAYREIESLTYTDAEGNERQASKEQFHELMQLPKKQAAERAEELFGRHMGQELMNHRRAVENLHRESAEAVANFEKEGQLREERATSERVAEDSTLQKVWASANQFAGEKFSEIFKSVESEEEAIVKQGFKNIDSVLSPILKSARQQNNPLLKTERGLQEVAIIRHSFPALLLESKRRKALESKLAKAEADLSEFRKGDAAQGDAGGRVDGNGKPDSAEADAMLESAFNRR